MDTIPLVLGSLAKNRPVRQTRMHKTHARHNRRVHPTVEAVGSSMIPESWNTSVGRGSWAVLLIKNPHDELPDVDFYPANRIRARGI